MALGPHFHATNLVCKKTVPDFGPASRHRQDLDLTGPLRLNLKEKAQGKLTVRIVFREHMYVRERLIHPHVIRCRHEPMPR